MILWSDTKERVKEMFQYQKRKARELDMTFGTNKCWIASLAYKDFIGIQITIPENPLKEKLYNPKYLGVVLRPTVT